MTEYIIICWQGYRAANKILKNRKTSIRIEEQSCKEVNLDHKVPQGRMFVVSIYSSDTSSSVTSVVIFNEKKKKLVCQQLPYSNERLECLCILGCRCVGVFMCIMQALVCVYVIHMYFLVCGCVLCDVHIFFSGRSSLSGICLQHRLFLFHRRGIPGFSYRRRRSTRTSPQVSITGKGVNAVHASHSPRTLLQTRRSFTTGG